MFLGDNMPDCVCFRNKLVNLWGWCKNIRNSNKKKTKVLICTEYIEEVMDSHLSFEIRFFKLNIKQQHITSKWRADRKLGERFKYLVRIRENRNGPGNIHQNAIILMPFFKL